MMATHGLQSLHDLSRTNSGAGIAGIASQKRFLQLVQAFGPPRADEVHM